MFDQPAFLASTEGPDRGFDPILLHVSPGGQERPPRSYAARFPNLVPNGMFQTPTNDSELSLVSSTRQFQEGAFLTDDGRKLLFVAGDSTYDSEDLYIATRSTSSGTFTSVKPFDHNVVGTNECCPTMAGNVVMYERPIAGGKKEIVSSILDGTTLSAPELVVLPGTNSFQQPSLSADGTRLVYVVNLGSDWHLEEAELSCP